MLLYLYNVCYFFVLRPKRHQHVYTIQRGNPVQCSIVLTVKHTAVINFIEKNVFTRLLVLYEK